MNPKWKTAFIVATISFVLGAVLALSSVFAVGFNMQKLNFSFMIVDGSLEIVVGENYGMFGNAEQASEYFSQVEDALSEIEAPE